MAKQIKPFHSYLALSLFGLCAVGIVYFNFYSQTTPSLSKSGTPQVKGASTTKVLAMPPAKTATPTNNSASADETDQSESISSLSQEISDLQDRVANLEANSNKAPAPQPVTIYKFVSQLDACKLNKLTKQGWRIYQLGTVVVASTGLIGGGSLDENCQAGPAQIIDWAVLQNP